MAALMESVGWTKVATDVGEYYYSNTEVCAQREPPLYEILLLSPSLHSDMSYTRHQIFKAYHERLAEYGGDEEAKSLLVQAYTTLTDPVARAAFDQRNCSKAARSSATGLLAMHLSGVKPQPVYEPPLDEEEPVADEG